MACILDAAAQVLLREGYARATTNRIAERAGISIGSLYQYFKDKDAVFDALVERYFALMVDAVREDPIDTALPLEESFRRLALLALRVWPRGPEVLRHLEHVPRANVRNRARKAKTELLGVLRMVVDGHRGQLRLRGDDLDMALRFVIGAGEGVLYDLPPKTDPDRTAREMAIMFAGYLSRGSG